MTTVLRRADGVLGGEVVLRTRQDDAGGTVYELVVDGVFAMDTAHTATEQQLAAAALDRVAGDELTVVVGGLGLGYTVAALLADARVAAVEVVELEPTLLDWLRAGVVPGVDVTLRDPRVRPRVGDVRDVLPAMPPGSADCVLLDVDNGPRFLVHGTNALVYEEPFLRSCLDVLRPGGALVVWSADPAPELGQRLTDVAGACEELPLTVHRDGRTFEYALYAASR